MVAEGQKEVITAEPMKTSEETGILNVNVTGARELFPDIRVALKS